MGVAAAKPAGALQTKSAEKYWPNEWIAKIGGTGFTELEEEVEIYINALAPRIHGKKVLKWVESFAAPFQCGKTTPVTEEDIALEQERINEDEARGKWDLREISAALGPVLHRVAKGIARGKIKKLDKDDGFNVWRVLRS